MGGNTKINIVKHLETVLKDVQDFGKKRAEIAPKWQHFADFGSILQVFTIICPFCAKFGYFWPGNHDFWGKKSKIT